MPARHAPLHRLQLQLWDPLCGLQFTSLPPSSRLVLSLPLFCSTCDPTMTSGGWPLELHAQDQWAARRGPHPGRGHELTRTLRRHQHITESRVTSSWELPSCEMRSELPGKSPGPREVAHNQKLPKCATVRTRVRAFACRGGTTVGPNVLALRSCVKKRNVLHNGPAAERCELAGWPGRRRGGGGDCSARPSPCPRPQRPPWLPRPRLSLQTPQRRRWDGTTVRARP